MRTKLIGYLNSLIGGLKGLILGGVLFAVGISLLILNAVLHYRAGDPVYAYILGSGLALFALAMIPPIRYLLASRHVAQKQQQTGSK